jgi:O-antigen ligase
MQSSSVVKKFNFLVVIFSLAIIFSVFSRFSISISIYSVIFFILFVTFVFFFNNFKFNLKNYYFFALLFSVIVIVSYYFADNKYDVRSEIFLLSSSIILYLLNGFLTKNEKKSILIVPICIGLWLAIYLFVINSVFSKFIELQELTRYMRSVSCFLLLALSLSFVFWQNERKIYFYMSFMLLFAIIMTKSLLAIGISGLAFAVYLFFIRKKLKIKTFFAIAPFVSMTFVSFYFLFKTSFFYNKLLMWKTALFVIKDHLLLGVGFNNYHTVSLAYKTIENLDMLIPDNIFLQILVENGIFGLVFFVMIIVIFFYFINKKIKKDEESLYLPILIAVTSFLFYNFFDSAVFISTNMLLFFFLLSFPLNSYNIKKRNTKINSYILNVLFLLLVFLMGKPLYAVQQYQKGLYFLANQKYPVAKDCFVSAICNDSLNSEYSSKLADIYFAMYQKTNQEVLLDFAIELYNYALDLNKYNGKYYYQLAWLYYFKGDDQKAYFSITKAIEVDPFNALYKDLLLLYY